MFSWGVCYKKLYEQTYQRKQPSMCFFMVSPWKKNRISKNKALDRKLKLRYRLFDTLLLETSGLLWCFTPKAIFTLDVFRTNNSLHEQKARKSCVFCSRHVDTNHFHGRRECKRFFVPGTSFLQKLPQGPEECCKPLRPHPFLLIFDLTVLHSKVVRMHCRHLWRTPKGLEVVFKLIASLRNKLHGINHLASFCVSVPTDFSRIDIG